MTAKEYYHENADAICARRRRRYAANRAAMNAKKRDYMKANPEKTKTWTRRKHLKRTYSLTVQQYDEMLQAQGGVCAICERTQQRRRLAVDHNHVTGNVRGLLCDNCNTGIGKFKDNPGLLLAAFNYLAPEIEFVRPLETTAA